MASVLKLGAGAGDDPFAKVKGLISDMIARLEEDANADATLKAYCDKEMAESNAKKNELSAEIKKKTVKMEQMEAESAKLKEEVATLQKELAELAATQAEMDKLRAEEKATFDANAPQMEAGIEGVKLALKILREYYASEDKDHVAAEGAGAGIIGLLEVAESDFSKLYAEMKVNEETAAAAYEKQSKENAVTKVMKERDVKYKTDFAAKLDKQVTEIKSDLEGLNTELVAVLDYLKKLADQCIAKPETYEERKAKREAEIAGLKEALTILENEAAFVQRSSSRRTLRGQAKLEAQ
jgi:chromosome segregation ATPase